MKSTEKFTGKAAVYEKYRPGYPKEALAFVTEGVSPGGAVADIGAGTGIFTRLLLENGFAVTAVEPNEEMQKAAKAFLKEYGMVSFSPGTAEDTGLSDGGFELVTVAQAFHWFDQKAFQAECRRVLQTDGAVALIWNNRDNTSALVKENAAVLKELCPQFTGFSGGMEQSPSLFASFFRDGSYEMREFPNPVALDKEAFLGRNLSSSYAPKVGDKGYEPFVEAINALFDRYSQDETLEMPYWTRVYKGRV